MRKSRKDINAPAFAIPEIVFETQALTSYGGIAIFQLLFRHLSLKERLASCFRHLKSAKSKAYSFAVIALGLIVHHLLGFKRLRDVDYHCDDPMLCRLLGVTSLPDVSTFTRSMMQVDEAAVTKARGLCRTIVLDGILREALSRITMDFDGSVLSTTSRTTEGTAVGFNKKKKGARSYYPLLCTVAQTGQAFDALPRPGNVHDSNGALAFVKECVESLRAVASKAVIETRLDSAHFNEDLVEWLREQGIQFTISVPFERFGQLKEMVESRKRWMPIDDTWSYFEKAWKPKQWSSECRFIFIRQKRLVPLKGPLQLDIFEPRSHEYEYKVIVTGKTESAASVLWFHNGRGGQENIIGQLKSETNVGYIPTRRLFGNQLYFVCGMIAHNLIRELQMLTQDRISRNTPKRAALWVFRTAGTILRRLVNRAGRISYPNGRLRVTMAANRAAQADILEMHDKLAAMLA